MTEQQIDAFVQGGEVLKRAIGGLSREQLLWAPPAEAGAGLWSIQQIVIHLLDCDLILTDRMKLILTEDHPRFEPLNVDRFVATLHYEEQSAEDAATILDLNRRNFARVLRNLPREAFDRTGQHPKRGVITLMTCLEMLTRHVPTHLEFIERKRVKLGVPLPGTEA
jgi:uncharacterized damage-inducible protein DinB